MTTIAYRDGILAADTLAVSSAHGRCGRIDKIRRGPRAELLALVGFAPTSFELLNWYLGGRDGAQPESEHSGSLIVISSAAVMIYCGGGCQPEAEAPFMAWGSGHQFAQGAMSMGATAEEAVSIARDFDIYTGGEITVLSL